jgi:hypothetical protein
MAMTQLNWSNPILERQSFDIKEVSRNTDFIVTKMIPKFSSDALNNLAYCRYHSFIY